MVEDEGIESLDFIEPWRCGECKNLMYNVDSKGYPSPGAPIGMSIKPYGKPMRVCMMCAQLYVTVLKSPYFKEIHKSWAQEQAHKMKLKIGNNYLDKKDND